MIVKADRPSASLLALMRVNNAGRANTNHVVTATNIRSYVTYVLI